jgi:hypothetical protein
VKASDTITYQKVGPTMFEILWYKMDELLAEYLSKKAVMTPSVTAPWAEARELTSLQGEMRGIAFAIQQWSAPWYDAPNAVAKHALRRYQAASTGEPMPDTVGCNGYNPLPILRAPQGFKNISKPNVSAETEKQIRNGLAAGFDANTLANLYKVSVQDVEAFR